MKNVKWRQVGARLAGVAAIAALLGFGVWFNLFRVRDVQAGQSSLRDHFLYGSMGTESDEGTPYWIWLVLPKVFPEYLPGPGGYASLGLTWEEGHELPMGVSKRFIGFDRVGVNCAFCHVSVARLSSHQAKPTIYPGGPGHQVRVQEYQQFLFDSAADPRFEASIIMPEIEAITKLSYREAALYRTVLIPLTRSALLKQRDEFAWQRSRPPHGPGRIDPFNPIRFRIFKEPDDQSIGNSDMPALWNQKAREGMSLHWDGLTTRFAETLISSAIGDGARGSHLDLASLEKITAFLRDLPAPRYPLAVDHALAETGRAIFGRECASCHAEGGARVGTVIALAEIATDPHRSNAWTQSQVDHWKELATEYQHQYGAKWNMDTFNKRAGYVAGLLDGIWLRGPYLHNGSVPSLRALLDHPELRPKVFYRGNDIIDRRGVGFVSGDAEVNGRQLFRYDTAVPGNSNEGHAYGVTLADPEKEALVEYLKTL